MDIRLIAAMSALSPLVPGELAFSMQFRGSHYVIQPRESLTYPKTAIYRLREDLKTKLVDGFWYATRPNCVFGNTCLWKYFRSPLMQSKLKER